MTEIISGKTKIYAIIGHPVEHSMSPAMHNAAFGQLEMDCVYVAFDVRPDNLTAAVDGMKSLGIPGWNVTIPHKINIIPLLDKLDPLAEKIGAVNTVVNNGGVLTGYNTDSTGFLRALLEKGIEPKGKSIAIVGAGGVILNRASGLERAKTLAAIISETTNIDVKAMELNDNNLAGVLEQADILVNTTSVGMSPNDDKSPVPAELIKADLTVYDVIYNPIKTKLLKDAEAAGVKIISGIDMLVWQGILAFEKWTGRKPPFDLMKSQAIKFL
jgi:shikimate dehydrogenase